MHIIAALKAEQAVAVVVELADGSRASADEHASRFTETGSNPFQAYGLHATGLKGCLDCAG